MSEPKRKYWPEMNDDEKLDAYQAAMEDQIAERDANRQLTEQFDRLAEGHRKYHQKIHEIAGNGNLDQEAKLQAASDADAELLDLLDDVMNWYTAEPPEPNYER